MIGCGDGVAPPVEARAEINKTSNTSSMPPAVAKTKSGGDAAAGRAASLPRLVVPEPIFEFGSMERNEVRSHQFILRNEGDAPLEMSEMAASCKCLSMQLSSTLIPPGGQGVLRVEWRGAESADTLTQRVRIGTNDPEHEIFEFTVLGAISFAVTVEPGRIELPPMVRGEAQSAELTVTSGMWDALAITDLECDIAGARLTSAPLEEDALAGLGSAGKPAPRSGARVRFELPPGAVDGELDGQVTFTARSPSGESRELRVAARAPIRQQITVSGPGALEDKLLKLGKVDHRQGLKRKFLVKINDEAPELVVKHKNVTPEYLRVALEPYKTGESSALYRMEVEVPAGAVRGALMGDKRGKIHFEFDHPRVRKLALEVELAPNS